MVRVYGGQVLVKSPLLDVQLLIFNFLNLSYLKCGPCSYTACLFNSLICNSDCMQFQRHLPLLAQVVMYNIQQMAACSE